jgi:hypothetical protein
MGMIGALKDGTVRKTWSYSLRVKSASKQKLENKYHPEGEMWND